MADGLESEGAVVVMILLMVLLVWGGAPGTNCQNAERR